MGSPVALLGRAPSGLGPDHERGEIDGEAPRQTLDVDQTEVPAAALDIAHIARMDPGGLGEALLGQAALQPQSADGSTESSEHLRQWGCVPSRRYETSRWLDHAR